MADLRTIRAFMVRDGAARLLTMRVSDLTTKKVLVLRSRVAASCMAFQAAMISGLMVLPAMHSIVWRRAALPRPHHEELR
jgi:hypothetical protein